MVEEGATLVVEGEDEGEQHESMGGMAGESSRSVWTAKRTT